MAENKEPSKEEKEFESKEKIRQLELGVLQSKSLIDLVIASAGRNTQLYGEMGKSATQANYVQALQNPDEQLTQVLTAPYLQSVMNAQKQGTDIYDEAISTTPSALLKNAQIIYRSALQKVKVSDVLGLIGIKEVHEGYISKEDRNMYIEDYIKKNKDMASMIVGKYMNSIQNQGVAKAIANADIQETKGLEAMLKEAPKPKEGKK